MVSNQLESLMQRKRSSAYKGNINFSGQVDRNIIQDDFFIIGPTDRESGLSVAYPNRLKRRMAARRDYPDENVPVKRAGGNNEAEPTITVAARGKRNEAIQTKCPRSALQEEIKLIRQEIERQKQQQNSLNTNYNNHDLNKPVERPIKHERLVNHPGERLKPPPCEDIDESETEAILKAPRTVKQKSREDLSEYGMRRLVEPVNIRQHSASPVRHSRLTEYQRAYRIPTISITSQQSEVPKNVRQNDPKRKNIKQIPKTDYSTEYSRQYIPFKYIAESELLSNVFAQTGTKCHLVPIRRPRSAYLEPKASARLAEVIKTVHQQRRAQTPPLVQTKPRATRYLTEYNAKYRQTPSQIKWPDAMIQSRKHAKEYRERQQASHFVADHLAQLDSNCVNLWDAPSSDRYAENYSRYKSLEAKPAAGKPSIAFWLPVNTNKKNSQSMCRDVMLSSQEVADILNSWDDERNGDGNCQQIRCHDVSIRNRPHTANPASSGTTRNHNFSKKTDRNPGSEGHVAQTTNWRIDATESTTESNRPQACKHIQLDKSGTTINNGKLGTSKSVSRERDHTDKIANKYENYQISPRLINPLSNRSITCSANIASDTLERARAQRDRMFARYTADRYQAVETGANNQPPVQCLQTVN